MDIALFSAPSFQGRDRMLRRLSRVDSEVATQDVARMIAAVVRANDGSFPGASHLNPMSAHALQQHLLSLMGTRPHAAPRDAKYRTLSHFCSQLLALRSTHPCLQVPSDLPLVERVTRKLWFTALEQELLSRTPKVEMARAWLMYEVIWPDLLNKGVFRVAHGDQATAAAAVHNALLLTVAMWQAGGWVEDPAAHFSNTTLGSAAGTLVDSFATSLNDLKTTIAPLRHYPRYSFRNPFVEAPIVRLETGALLAPDPSCLFAAFERTMTAKVLRQAVLEAGQDGFGDWSKAIGKVFEEYARRLLSSQDVTLGGRFQEEFKYGPEHLRVDSPDAFILRPRRSLVFEFKATRFPYEVDGLLQDPGGHLWGWISKVLGATTTRQALDQGRSFFRAAPQLDELAGFDLSDALYLITVYPAVPPMLNSKRWREEWLLAREPSLRGDLFDRLAFVSIHDLEIAAATAQVGHGTPNLADIVNDWWRMQQNVDLRDRLEEGGLGDYCLRKSEYSQTIDVARSDHAQQLLHADMRDQRPTLGPGTSDPRWGDGAPSHGGPAPGRLVTPPRMGDVVVVAGEV